MLHMTRLASPKSCCAAIERERERGDYSMWPADKSDNVCQRNLIVPQTQSSTKLKTCIRSFRRHMSCCCSFLKPFVHRRYLLTADVSIPKAAWSWAVVQQQHAQLQCGNTELKLFLLHTFSALQLSIVGDAQPHWCSKDGASCFTVHL